MFFVCIALLLANTVAYRPSKVASSSSSKLFYNYFKKDGEKREIGRLWKNIIFPGIYQEYQDTAEPKKTIKIKVEEKKKTTSSRNGDDSFFSQNSKQGTYNMVDPSTAPKVSSMLVAKKTSLQPVRAPAGFVSPKRGGGAPSGGVKVMPGLGPRPSKPVILYEYEGNADCKRVREACSMLDLVVEIRPCPAAAYGFSDQMASVSLGRRQVPFMIDNNPIYRPQLTSTTEILEHLFINYGGGIAKMPASLKSNGLSLFGGNKGAGLRKNSRPDSTQIKPLTLYGWEGAGRVKQVREALNDLGLAHVLVNCGEGSVNRAKLIAKIGSFDVPFLIDPNTGVEMTDSKEIVKYLEQVYTI